MERARQMEEEGQRIIKLNIAISRRSASKRRKRYSMGDVILNLPNSSGFRLQGLVRRRARPSCTTARRRRFPGVGLEDIYIGNGASN